MNQWAPWISDPDDPNVNMMLSDESKAAAANVARLFMRDYNPNHEPAGSDKGGQFAVKGTGTSTISMVPDPDKTAEVMFNDIVPKDLQERMAKDLAIAKAMPETYLDNSPQRQLMREKIADKLYNKDIEKRVQGREATIILGLPGAGKSTLAQPMLDNGAIEIDPDIVKGEIPEFNGGIGANAVHEESSAINKEILKRAIANGDNIVWPRINGKDKLKRDVEMMQKNGYKVKVQIINVTPETAIRSAVDRYVKSGRLVSPSTIIEYGNTPMETYEAAADIPGVTVEKYKRDHGKGVERDHTQDADAFTFEYLADINPNHMPAGNEHGGEFAPKGIGPDTLRSLKSIDTVELASGLINYYNKAGEIMNPDYERVAYATNKLFEKEAKVVQYAALDVMHRTRAEGKEDERFVDFYYGAPSGFVNLNKFGRTVAAGKGDDADMVSFKAQANAFIDKWKPIGESLKELKGKAVKMTTKREETKAVAAKELERKYTDSAPLIKLFESHLDEYKNVAAQRAQEYIDRKVNTLKEAGWDLSKVAPEPDSLKHSRTEYTSMKALRSTYEQFLKPKSYTGFSWQRKDEPDIREFDKKRAASYVSANVQLAEDAYRDFMQKMTEKIGKPVTKAEMTGNIWTNAILKVETDDGEKQTWHTQMILNFSKYDKMFNQFPSRRKDVKDSNPNHDPKTGEFTFAEGTFNNRYPAKGPGIYAGTSQGKTRSGKKSSMRHEVWAKHWEEASQIMKERHSTEHPRVLTSEVSVGSMQYVGKEKKEALPPTKQPNAGSKEDKFLQEMQARVDEQKGYKGD